jgi:hypothetical protein
MRRTISLRPIDEPPANLADQSQTAIILPVRALFVLVVVACAVVGNSWAGSGTARGPVTRVYFGPKLYGSITFVPAHNGIGAGWDLSRRILTCAASLEIFINGGEIIFESEGNDYFVARRRSATTWIIYGDDFGTGAKRPRVGSVVRRPGSSWWNIYSKGRMLGHARGRDGGAAGLALIGCQG